MMQSPADAPKLPSPADEQAEWDKAIDSLEATLDRVRNRLSFLTHPYFGRPEHGAPVSDAGKVERQWPDIGSDPMTGPRPDDRYEVSAVACRAAYVKQQPHVPDQTALVWRWHLGALLEEHLRLHAILARLADVPAEPVLISRKLDDDCGCPEEVWEAYGAHLFMHLAAGKPSDGHADYGDEGEREITVIADTTDLARDAIFGWCKSLAAPAGRGRAR